MPGFPSALASYVARASEGRNALWRVVLGMAVVAAVWMATTTVALMAGLAYTDALRSLSGRSGEGAWPVLQDLLGTPPGLAAMLASFGGVWIGVWLAARLLHRRSLGGVVGAAGRISWRNFRRGLVAALLVSALSEAAFYLADPSIVRSDVPLATWFAWLVPLVLLLLVQTSAEEVVFRGYLMQSLAALSRRVIVWAGLPTVLFTLLHWNSEADPAMNAAALVSIAAFALAATLLVVRTGDLGAAIGVHLGVNAFSILLVGRTSWLDGVALLEGRTVDTGSWAPLAAVWLAVVSIATFALMLWLLLDRRSPLRVGADAPLPAHSGGIPAS